MSYLKKIMNLLDPTKIYLPDNTSLAPTVSGILNLHPKLPDKAQEARVVPGLSNSSLFSIGQDCDEGCYTIFSSTHLQIIRNGEILITGYRNQNDGLWDIPLTNPNPQEHQYARQALNIVVNKTQSKSDLAKYLHGCAFSPVIFTFKTAIAKENYVTYLGINSINFTKLVGPTIPTAKGHLDQERQGLQSTKPQIRLEDAHDDAFPPQSKPKTQEMGITITSVKNIAYSDLTGQFPHISSRGHTYLLTIYDYDANDILAGTLKIRQAKEIATVWKKRHLQLTKNGHEVKYYIMDN